MRFMAVRFAISVQSPRRAKPKRIASPGFWECAEGGFVLLSQFHVSSPSMRVLLLPPKRACNAWAVPQNTMDAFQLV
jgi:hypothetical protein